ncbi:MAG: hypothetical protein K2J80_04195 [Oscillospiraceae bacterium]|nr:hypothetical protein [Oscillospiraceae bacterium]
MKQGSNKSFLRNGIILAAAVVLICVFMPEWGAAQIAVVVLVAILAGFQCFLYFYMK